MLIPKIVNGSQNLQCNKAITKVFGSLGQHRLINNSSNKLLRHQDEISILDILQGSEMQMLKSSARFMT